MFGSVSSKDHRCAPPPTSISMAMSQNHPLSHFPALNSNQGGYAGAGVDDEDPHNPWITVHSTRSRNTRSGSHSLSKNARFASPHEERHNSSSTRPNPFMESPSYVWSKGPPNGGGPPDGEGSPSGGSPSGPRNPPRRVNEATPRPGEYQRSLRPGPTGGDPPGGDPGYGIEPEEKGPDDEKSKAEWQLNNKISIGAIPQWDGNPTTMIDYIMEIALLARLSKRIFKEIGQIAPIRWTGSAKGWWMTLPRADQAYFSQDWECLVTGMRDHFMNDVWLNDRSIEFDAMRFRRGHQHARETPEEYFNRRIRLNMVLHPEETDGPKVTHRLMNRQPILWGSILNTTSCPSIVQLMKLAKAMEANLVAQYYNRLRIEKSKSVHAVEAASPEDSDKSTEDAGPSTTKEAHVASRGGPRKRTDWPKGRTISGYSYSRDNSVVSKVAPLGPCFICLSPKHFFRDCPHNARFFGKSAHSAEVVIDNDELRDLDLEYYNHVSNAITSASDYESPDPEMNLSGTTEARDRRNRNERRREKFEMKSKQKGKRVVKDMPQENRATRRRLKLHKLAATMATENSIGPSPILWQEADIFSDKEDIVDYPEPVTSDTDSHSNSEGQGSSAASSSSSSSSLLPSVLAMKTESRKVTIEEVEDPQAPPRFKSSSETTAQKKEDPEAFVQAKRPNEYPAGEELGNYTPLVFNLDYVTCFRGRCKHSRYESSPSISQVNIIKLFLQSVAFISAIL